MFTEYFVQAEASYRQQRFRQEADEYRLARSASRCTRPWLARLRGFRLADAISGSRVAGNGVAGRRPASRTC